MTRIPVSKKVRFEVFKRDSFTCQYCGRVAPNVVLECDHIEPVVEGGSSDILNLITSCLDCNSGKGGRKLTDDTVVSKKMEQARLLQERREQLEMIAEWQRGLLDVEDQAVHIILDLYHRLVPGWDLSDKALATCKKYVSDYGLASLLDQLRTFTKNIVIEDQKATAWSAENCCTQWINWLKYRKSREKDPVGNELRYIFGIARNRFHHCPDYARSLLRAAYDNGSTLLELKELALNARNWSLFRETLESKAPTRLNTSTAANDDSTLLERRNAALALSEKRVGRPF